ncbi:PTS transporter subunit EIIC [Brachyspira hyodysenteriae]|uniref:Fused beta-glucoside-specific PTS enzymes: IIA component/IIB component/IIC component n=1 Tax=Brachyspira hyodysenteriae (strain ATCC 49526 / WA1) TaxID=565034 RepID=A0A3B6VB04_BRAHW|nr:PTS transporter subunit EIIC [Brachyspira hyodysenteriae]ACN83557.1 fused beta-glucoside-specific PTS enzymes: IIA component/IIB component/IIC component [Brachyspira hyodysenteriae WA1]KLI44973.1 PTS beta-glucoside transporter subunit IIABC [Brachyspira hyodysenteriae]KLI47970.1 PTS beta-glucoside transporter subunit IIABC [Brachyspira hyodysenteriae]KLI48199.1 PTS beta-glucoside transporter subunit IIABC [Brachyspira hyodysenteriae]KLI54141.1 PTS beta-glucoside transporter subunit IIABC [B
MAKNKINYEELGGIILPYIGGKENIHKLTHCATRLRFELKNRDIVDVDSIKALDGVIDVVEGGGQFQIIIGMNVQTVYKSLNRVLGSSNDSINSSSSEKPAKKSLLERFMNTISTIFTPMIPAITGAGMIKAILAILVLTKAIDTNGHTYYILNMISDAAFYFLPMLLAYGAALKFECNPILSITLAGVLLHPSWIALVNGNEAASLFAIKLTLVDYSGSVLPIIITVWIQSFIEKYADKYSPEMIKFFTKPLITILLTGILALLFIGPLGSKLNDIVASFANILNDKVSWLIPLLMGALQPVMLLTGTAWSLTPIATMQIAKNGYEQVNGPGMLASNIAQGGATLAVALKAKDKELKQLAASTGFTALLGITEPSLFGVTVKLKTPLIAAMIGGGVGGIYAGLSGLVRYAFVSPGLTALPVFIGENPMNIVHAIITCVISFAVGFIVSFFITKIE